MRYWMLSLCAVAVFAFGFTSESSASEFRSGGKSITAHGHHGGGWGRRNGGGRGWGHGGGRHYNGDGYGRCW